MLPQAPLGQAALAARPDAVDWREPERRRQAFLDFFDFHTRYGIHPGCVYFLIPWLRRRYGWDSEQAYWFAFLNGNTQNPLTTLQLHRRGDRPEHAADMLGWYDEHVNQLPWDTDRRYHRRALRASVDGYVRMLGGELQVDFWAAVAGGGWRSVWAAATAIPTFARLSGWSFCDYLHICGTDLACNDLMLDDKSGSRSHRNGLCIVNGLDVYDWHQSNPSFDGRYPRRLLTHLDGRAWGLLADARDRAEGKPWQRDVTALTLESALCTYKGWHRPNRRYPGVYADMLYDRIRQAEERFPDDDFTPFWQARRECLPPWLRLEDRRGDPGLHPIKQNHYRLTGEVPVMGHDKPNPHYWSAFDDAVEAETLGVFR